MRVFYRIYFFGFCIVFIFVYIGCSARIPSCLEISPPKIDMTGEKTVIERQIVGDYKELERDAWILSSVKTNIQRRKGTTLVAGGDRKLLLAMKTREFHLDKIRAFKSDGSVGEGKNGFIVYRQTSQYEKDKKLRQSLLRFIDEENKARRVIFERSLISSGIKKPEEKEIIGFGQIFAEEQRALAKKGDWIQNKTGNWIKKK